MNFPSITRAALALPLAAATLAAHAQRTPEADRHPPPPVRVAPAPTPAPEPPGGFVYEQSVVPGRVQLVSSEQAREIVERFRETYRSMGKPRMLVFVNRELIGEDSGMVQVARTERYDTTRTERTMDFQPAPGAQQATQSTAGATSITAGGSVTISGSAAPIQSFVPGTGRASDEVTRTTGENRYEFRERTRPSLADRQTTRDVERLFGRPLRLGGASLADQRIGAQLIGTHSVDGLARSAGGESAQEREALLRHADVVVEVLIGSRAVSRVGFNGTEVTTIPDIQATAIRLSDARILGQATASDVLGADRVAAATAQRFDVRDIAEATALALMQDMMLHARASSEN